MSRFWIGGSGALCVDEKMHIHSLVRQNGEKAQKLTDMRFAICDDKGRTYVLDEDFSEVKCKQALLGASYKFSDAAFSAKISASAVTPFGFGKDAHIPAAAFLFKIKNTSKKKRIYTFAAMAENFLGDTLQEQIATKYGRGVHMSSASTLSVCSDYMTHCLLSDCETHTVRYLERDNARESFIESLRGGNEEDRKYGIPAQRDCAAVYCSFALESGESKTVRMVYAWYVPNMQVSLGEQRLLVKDLHLDAFTDSAAVADYVLENWNRFIESSRQCTKAIRTNVGVGAFERAIFDNLHTIQNAYDYVLAEQGASKLFMKNQYGAQKLFVQTAEALFPATVYFDFDAEVQAIEWAIQYALESDGKYNGLPCIETTEKTIEQQVLSQFSLIWRVYRLYVLSGDLNYITRFWDKAEQILRYANIAGWVRAGEAVIGFENDEGFTYSLMLTNAYLLSLMCVQKMAELTQQSESATEYAKLIADGQGFVRRNFFNGQFFNESYPTEEEKGRCGIQQLLPVCIGKTLGLEVTDVGQNAIALENIYVQNYLGDEDCGVYGVKVYSDEEAFDAGAELLYAETLLQADKTYLASLVCKAQYVRESESHKNTAESIFVNALFGTGYDAVERSLHIDKAGLLCFAKNAFIYTTEEKMKTVRVCGEPIKIDSLYYAGKGKISRVFYGEMELLFVRDGDAVHLNAPLVLSEGEELRIIL
ncbi:MAG: hypothetical protein IJD83_00920 [Clostridia bacterium]|nr:hypothetical protein [Clostridia bacterium]